MIRNHQLDTYLPFFSYAGLHLLPNYTNLHNKGNMTSIICFSEPLENKQSERSLPSS
uniref:Uncharacterized protein n=1 Tax=Arundo donax TaxID=35708 RepID=A0A0A8Z3S3_ARUDO